MLLWYCPDGHRSHNVSDVDATDVNRPAAHGIHDVEPEKFWYCPYGHTLHLVAELPTLEVVASWS